MNDLILAARLDALKQHLQQAKDPKRWLQQITPFPSGKQVPNELWNALDLAIGTQARGPLQQRFDTMLAAYTHAALLNPPPAGALRHVWQAFADIDRDCRQLLGECLEFFGGLTMRYHNLDQGICEIADELIKSCVNESIPRVPWQGMSVPALHDIVVKTLARLLRLHYSEWTVWSLPLTAHGYGLVAFDDDKNFNKFATTKADDWAKALPEWAEASQGQREALQERVRTHTKTLLADAFATYCMGPSYAFAAVLLHFNPLAGTARSASGPPEAERAEAIFAMLQKMSVEDKLNLPYEPIVKTLTTRWSDTLDHVGQPRPLAPQRTQDIQALVDAAWTFFYEQMLTTAKYPCAAVVGETKGWPAATALAAALLEQDAGALSAHSLRDVLNAAWLRREAQAHPVVEITRKAHALCLAIIKDKRVVQAADLLKQNRSASFGTGTPRRRRKS